jgi:formate hydrogenlyase subunit 3/multisubunit Na+/H+ antiporter MnhD subunit
MTFIKKVTRDASIWNVLASVLPMTALALIALLRFFNADILLDRFIIIIITVMFFVAVIWWWWTLRTILKLTRFMENTVRSFSSIKQDIRKVKKDITEVIK